MLFRSLIGYGADINHARSSCGLTPLMAAMLCRQQAAIDHLLSDPGINMNHGVRLLSCYIRPVFIALHTNQTQFVRKCLQSWTGRSAPSYYELLLLEEALEKNNRLSVLDLGKSDVWLDTCQTFLGDEPKENPDSIHAVIWRSVRGMEAELRGKVQGARVRKGR